MAAPRRRQPRNDAAPTDAGLQDYRYADTRLNNPPAGLVSYESKVREPKRQRYAYDPHLSPQLVWAGKAGLKSIEVEDAAAVEAEEVALHVHERVSTQAIVSAVRGRRASRRRGESGWSKMQAT
jgi:adenine-specific DNA-methyltransferase